MILDEKFFLKTKTFLFSLLCIIHINGAYQIVIPLPALHIQNSILCKIYALQNEVYRDLSKSYDSEYRLIVNKIFAMKIEKKLLSIPRGTTWREFVCIYFDIIFYLSILKTFSDLWSHA